MRGTFYLQKPDEINATLTITLSLKTWKELRDSLRDKWPDVELSTLISNAVYTAERTFFVDSEDTDASR
jgi:hypothetical protein